MDVDVRVLSAMNMSPAGSDKIGEAETGSLLSPERGVFSGAAPAGASGRCSSLGGALSGGIQQKDAQAGF